MTGESKPDRTYRVHTDEPGRPPNYQRVVRGLTDQELRDEFVTAKGSLGFLEACAEEADRRGITLA